MDERKQARRARAPARGDRPRNPALSSSDARASLRTCSSCARARRASRPSPTAHHIQALEQAVDAAASRAAPCGPSSSAIDAACRVFEVVPAGRLRRRRGRLRLDGARVTTSAAAPSSSAPKRRGRALDEVARSRAEFAVVPYESLKDGPIFPTIQAIAGADLKLVGRARGHAGARPHERDGKPGRRREDLRRPAGPRRAASRYLEANHPRALGARRAIARHGAAELASENHGSAAIVPRGARLRDGSRVARENIGDDGEVRMRYGVVSRLPAPRSGADATAAALRRPRPPWRAPRHPAALQGARAATCGASSRGPCPGEGWEYVFYVEVSGHVTDRHLVAALEGVKREAKMLKIIGSFPLEFPERSTVPAMKSLPACRAVAAHSPPCAFRFRSLSCSTGGCGGADETLVLVGGRAGRRRDDRPRPARALAERAGHARLPRRGRDVPLEPRPRRRADRSRAVLPLGPESNFVPSRDVTRIYGGVYAMQGVDFCAVVQGNFDVDAIQRAADARDDGRLAARPLVQDALRRSYDLYTAGNVGFVMLTPTRCSPATRRACAARSTGCDDGPRAIGARLDDRAARDAERGVCPGGRHQRARRGRGGDAKMPFLTGLQKVRTIGNFQPPGMNFAGSFTYADAQAAANGTGAARGRPEAHAAS